MTRLDDEALAGVVGLDEEHQYRYVDCATVSLTGTQVPWSGCGSAANNTPCIQCQVGFDSFEDYEPGGQKVFVQGGDARCDAATFWKKVGYCTNGVCGNYDPPIPNGCGGRVPNANLQPGGGGP